MDDLSAFDRFVSLAKRELSADDVKILPHAEDPPDTGHVVVARLFDGRHVVASFASAPKEPDVLARRLAILGDTFADALGGSNSERTRTRPPVASSLHEELKALAVRSSAKDVAVIDIDSPVLWGCASVRGKPRARESVQLREVPHARISAPADSEPARAPYESSLAESPHPEEVSEAVTGVVESGPLEDTLPRDREPVAPDESARLLSDDGEDHRPEPELTRLTIAAVRRLPELDHLHKGAHLHHVERESPYYLAISFSGIYLLVLIFDAPFDELRAERASQDSMGRIERLVLALPPLDPGPEPMGGVVAMRRPRRR